MAKKSIVALISLVFLLTAGLSWAQDEGTTEDPDETFSLTVGDEVAKDIAEEEIENLKYEPELEKGTFDLTLTLGFFGMSETLWQHDRIIYKATDDAFFYGNVKNQGESAFNPILRLGYNFTTWLALEVSTGVSFSEFQAEITNPMTVNAETPGNPQDVVELGEYDAEHRSALTWISNLNALLYPLNLDGNGKGRWHPYVAGGVGYALYNLDSAYYAGSATGINGNLGLGIRMIADDLVSLRFEVLYQVHNIQFDVADYFTERDGGTVKIPVYEFNEAGFYSQVQEYESRTLGGLAWQLGFTIGF